MSTSEEQKKIEELKQLLVETQKKELDLKEQLQKLQKVLDDEKKEKEPKKEKVEKKEEIIELTKEQEEAFNLIRSVGEECIKDEELKKLIKSGKQMIAYDGFEPSGRIHIAQGVMKAMNVNKMTKSGVNFTFLVADWFALMNNKMGGDLKKIKVVGEYLVEVWKAIGMDLTKVEFKRSSDIINEKSDEYWLLVLDIARTFNVARIKRCSQIMGRNDEDDLSVAQYFYPCMQCADIFFLKADICQLGLDQRKVNMLAREYCDLKKKKFKPIILSHHMLAGLTGEKMSKSNPDSAIFMDDSEKEVNTKIKKAFCEPGNIKVNPCLEYLKYIVLPYSNEFIISRKEENGGDLKYLKYEDIEKDFVEGKLHPADLKPSLAKAINIILQPVRDHFKNDKNASDLLKKVKAYKTTK